MIRATAAGEVVALTRRLGRGGDPLASYRQLTDGRPHTFLLDGSVAGDEATRPSLVGVRSAVHLTATRDQVVVDPLTPNGDAAVDWLAGRVDGRRERRRLTIPLPPVPVTEEAARFRQPSPFDVLRRLAFEVEVRDEAMPFCHVLAGIIGYDAIDYFEALPVGGADPLDQPLVEFWVPDRLVVIDHGLRTSTVVATAWGGPGFEGRRVEAERELALLVDALERVDDADDGEAAPSRGDRSPAVAADLGDEAFGAMVETVKQHLEAGEAYQVVPSRTFRLPCGDPLVAFGELRRSNPSPYSFYFVSGDRVLFGASPERHLLVDGATRRVSVTPIAGTAARGRGTNGMVDVDLDGRREIALRQDSKEAAEHLMLVDLARNDVARVAVPGSRQVSRLLSVERYQHVMHLTSEVTGTLAHGIDALEAYAATMPMGTLVGAPKVKAADLLRRLEPTRRGWYGGGVGYLRRDGTLETAIVIRSAVVKGGVAFVRAGAGVVLDSDPRSEARETTAKARAVLEAIRRSEASRHG
jgi:anthranilate synthase component 1